jgi:hypothetical protein
MVFDDIILGDFEPVWGKFSDQSSSELFAIHKQERFS